MRRYHLVEEGEKGSYFAENLPYCHFQENASGWLIGFGGAVGAQGWRKVLASFPCG